MVHAVDHLDAGDQVCQLCHARDDNATAITPTPPAVAPHVTFHSLPVISIQSAVTGFTTYFSARAPPSLPV